MLEKVSKVDYSKGQIYKLCCKNVDIQDEYVGSTTNFKQRKKAHKNNCYNANDRKYDLNVYKFIRDNGGFENWDMILIEEYSCNSKKQLESRERYWIEKLKCSLNSSLPTRTVKQYRQQNKEKYKQHSRNYYERNKEKEKERSKKYIDNNKEKIKENKQKWYQNNKEKEKERSKNYKEVNKKDLTEKRKLQYEEINEKRREKVECIHCKMIINKSSLIRHQKSKKCLKFRECLIE